MLRFSKPVPLAALEPPAGDLTTVTGWGSLESGAFADYPSELNVVTMPIVERAGKLNH